MKIGQDAMQVYEAIKVWQSQSFQDDGDDGSSQTAITLLKVVLQAIGVDSITNDNVRIIMIIINVD